MSLQRNLIVLLASCLAVALASTRPDIRGPNAELSLLGFMSRSNSALQNDPQRSLACFEYYIPLINEIAEKYENDFKACLTASEQALSAAEAATADERDALAKTVAGACSTLTQCAQGSSATDIFQCYINEGAGGAKTLYSVSTQATVQLAALEESIRRIQSDENVCTTETKIQYEKDSAEAYDNFNKCILGISDVPTTTTTTVAPTTEPTTEAPTTTDEPATAETTTDLPTTLAPTEEPSTTESANENPINVMPEEDIYRLIRRLKQLKLKTPL